MFDELNAYKDNGHFFFRTGDLLSRVCNAPEKPGVYLIYQLQKGKVDLVYIGASGTMNQNGSFKSQLLKGRINNIQDGVKRQILFDNKIFEVGIDALDIYWYVTFDNSNGHIPSFVEGQLMQRYFETFGRLPSWNKCY
jgi:hypothetical protein